MRLSQYCHVFEFFNPKKIAGERVNKKKSAMIRITAIGILHAAVFLWLIPQVLIPLFGGWKDAPATIITAVLTIGITMVILFFPALRCFRRRK
jgi:uncharacterized protein with PQ loop repeat